MLSKIKIDKAGEPTLSYEEVDTSLIPPRPRLYGLVGAEIIEQVWKERQAGHRATSQSSNGAEADSPTTIAAS